jgi:hypothetical protein
MKKKRFYDFFKSLTVRREKRPLFVPLEVLMEGCVIDYLRAISRSLPDVVVLRPEFFKIRSGGGKEAKRRC